MIFSTMSLFSATLCAQVKNPSHEWVKDYLQKGQQEWADASLNIWDYAELGYLEHKSSALLKNKLKEHGFLIEEVKGIPTAFVATYGTGTPVIGILGEYDALPGLSQAATFERKPIEGKNAGHACGHHLFGTGSVAAAIAVAEWLKQTKHPGIIKFFGCPAEEGGSGKVYMARDGVFNSVDVMLHWHAGDKNMAVMDKALANMSGKFRFYGVSAHAAGAPHKGRSALDGVEAMSMMANMMREHIPSDARLHYVITQGGKAPNVVPDFAEAYYYVRHPEKEQVIEIWKWLNEIAKGAAQGTQTRVEVEVIGGTYNLLPNEPLARQMYNNLIEVGGVQYDERESDIAKKIAVSFNYNTDPSEASRIQPFEHERSGFGSTDVGDVSWQVPTTGLRTATWVPGTSAHSWQAVAVGATSIATKGMIVAAKTLACTMLDLLQTPTLVAQAKKDFTERRGDSKYEPLVGDRKAPLNYRE